MKNKNNKIIQRSFNVLGNIAVINFSDGVKSKDKKKFAGDLLKNNSYIKTVLEKSRNFKGRLRKMETRFLAGEKNKEVLYKENGCVFRFNVDTTYFSPRLSNERNEISKLVRKGDEVLVLFAGVAPFSIVIAKNSKAKKVYSNEINREANKYAKLNIDLNKVQDRVELVNGDAKRVCEKLSTRGCTPPSRSRGRRCENLFEAPNQVGLKEDFKKKSLQRAKKFDVIVMARPNLKETFLKDAFKVSKKGTRIFYYGFCKIEDIDKIVELIKEKASESKKKIKILNVKHAGEIAPYKIRVRVDFEILN